MNWLSWMIYLADVSDGLQAKIGALGMGLIAAFFGVALASTVTLECGPFTKPAKWRPAWFYTGVALLLVNVVIPGKATIYAIAASQGGETVLNSPTGSKAVQALNAWLDRQIKGDDPKSDQHS